MGGGGHPEWHFEDDIFEVIRREKPFDLGIMHPPCTWVAGSGVQWLSHPDDVQLPFDERRPHPLYPERRNDMKESVKFIKALYSCQIPKVAIENPSGMLSSLWRKPDQIIQPFMFGDEAQKTTCLWLKGLPPLYHNKIANLFDQNITHVGKGEMVHWVDKKGKKKSMPKWYYEAMALPKSERQEIRSKTFPGIAKAMADQWG